MCCVPHGINDTILIFDICDPLYPPDEYSFERKNSNDSILKIPISFMMSTFSNKNYKYNLGRFLLWKEN